MPATDHFKSLSPSISGPVAHGAEVIPDDGLDLAHVTRAIYIGGAGDVRVTMADGGVVTFAALSAGWHPVRVSRVHATATTATNIIGTW